MDKPKVEKQRIDAIGYLRNYRYPKDGHTSGDFAIVLFSIAKVLDGEIKSDQWIRPGSNVIIVRGGMPAIEDGIRYRIMATYSPDPKWGPQFECDCIRMDYNLEDPKDQRKFLSYLLSEAQIDRLFSEFENPVEVLAKKDYSALTKIKGIGLVTAQRLCQLYEDNIDNSRAYVELKEMGLKKKTIDKLIEKFGSQDVAIDMILDNPYRLIELVPGYGWIRADHIALSNGYTRDCKGRIMAYARYYLYKLANEEGSSCMSFDAFLDVISEECAPATRNDIMKYLSEKTIKTVDFEAICKGELHVPSGGEDAPVFFFDEVDRKIGLFKYRKLEYDIVTELQRLRNTSSRYKFDRTICNKIIEEIEKADKITYTMEQRKAIYNMLDSNVAILTGSAGTGKSSTLKPLIHIFQYYKITVAQCALSGRASSLLTEYTGIEGKTIHRLLEYKPEEEKFCRHAGNPLTYDVVFLDETSMVGEELFYSLISSIKTGGKLIMLGDTKQLPPIAVGNILDDCIRSGYVLVNRLSIIHRQALRSGIISQSIAASEGKPLVPHGFIGEKICGELEDFKIVTNEDPLLVHKKIIEEFKRMYDSGVKSDDIQIIVPMRSRGNNSCRCLNAELQEIVNGTHYANEITVEILDNGQKYQVTYKPNDKIIVTKNNYHARTPSGSEVAIFNGNMGHIVDIVSGIMQIRLNDGTDVLIPLKEWDDISHAWAITCHRLQGSNALYTIVAIDNGAFTLLSREWLYTAITRARKFCTVIAQPGALQRSSHISDVKIKNTWLAGDLKNLYTKMISSL